MSKKFGFYKTIVLALASAVTLIAVSFAWFSTSNKMEIGAFSEYTLGDNVINVAFFKDSGGTYVPTTDDFDVEFNPAGGASNYKIVVKKSGSGTINLNFSILELDTISADLKNNVYIDYSLVPLKNNGNGSYTEQTPILTSYDSPVDNKLLKEMNESIFSASLNSSDIRDYAIYYTIGLKAGASIGAVNDASLGRISISGTAAE